VVTEPELGPALQTAVVRIAIGLSPEHDLDLSLDGGVLESHR
jgi:hypothetical protein